LPLGSKLNTNQNWFMRRSRAHVAPHKVLLSVRAARRMLWLPHRSYETATQTSSPHVVALLTLPARRPIVGVSLAQDHSCFDSSPSRSRYVSRKCLRKRRCAGGEAACRGGIQLQPFSRVVRAASSSSISRFMKEFVASLRSQQIL